jgi:hypothetical protein
MKEKNQEAEPITAIRKEGSLLENNPFQKLEWAIDSSFVKPMNPAPFKGISYSSSDLRQVNTFFI